MPHEIKRLKQITLGTMRHLKYEVYDALGSDITISSCTFVVRDSNKNVISNGTATADNADTDQAGNTIATVMAAVDFGQTDYSTGHYQLRLYVVFASGETDKFIVPLEVLDYEEVK